MRHCEGDPAQLGKVDRPPARTSRRACQSFQRKGRHSRWHLLLGAAGPLHPRAAGPDHTAARHHQVNGAAPALSALRHRQPRERSTESTGHAADPPRGGRGGPDTTLFRDPSAGRPPTGLPVAIVVVWRIIGQWKSASHSPRDGTGSVGRAPCTASTAPSRPWCRQTREKLVWIGPDDRGLDVEVVAIVEPDYPLVIHVMPHQFRRRTP